ncbi:MAG: zinc-dependent metalloprotease family protein [Planctomycetota bacterium]
MTGLRSFVASAAVLIGAPLAASAQFTTHTPDASDAALALGLNRADVIEVELSGAPGISTTAWVEIDGEERLMVLNPQPVGGDKYQVLEHLGGDEYRAVEPTTTVTFRGEIVGMPGTAVAASWLENGLHARLFHEDGSSDWIEPLAGKVPGFGIDQYAMYNDRDVAEHGGTCGVSEAQSVYSNQLSQSSQASQFGPETAEGTALLIAELGVDTDFEYFQDYGSVAAVENRINAVINTMNVQYEGDVGIRHEITTIIVRSNANDPYTTTSASTFLNQFANHWVNQQGSVQRDIAHLFSGKNIAGGTIGIAFLATICSNGAGYGLVESDCCGSFAAATDLSAHELGHNWSAGHCSCTSPAYTMNPFLLAANRFNPNITIPQITNYAANRPCLDSGSTAGPEPVIESLSPFFITAVEPESPVQVTIEGTGFNNLTSVEVDGVPLSSFPPEFFVVDDTEVRVTLTPPYNVGTKTITINEGPVSVSTNLQVFFNSQPRIDLVGSNSFLLSALPLEIYVGGPANGTHFLLLSFSNLPSSFPGLFELGIGNAGTDLFLIADQSVDPVDGFGEIIIPLNGAGGPGITFYLQSVFLDPASPFFPLQASNVETGSFIF